MLVRPERIAPGPGQESVWDYPRPPRLEPVRETLAVVFAGHTIAETSRGHRVLETSHPPVYYIPLVDIRREYLIPGSGRSYCEFKGMSGYWSLDVEGRLSRNAAWSYPDPTPAFAAIAGDLAFYASRVDECWVGDEKVTAQDGDFYGGWITSAVVGPFKGARGTLAW